MRAVVLACLAYAAIADPEVGQIANAMSKSFLPAATPGKAPAIPSGVAAPIPVGSSNPVDSPPAVWNGFQNIEGEIHNLEAQNAALQMEIGNMKTQLDTMEAAKSYQPASAQDQWGSGKLFMGFGAFGLGGALMYSILQTLFPSNRSRHDARAAPLMSMSTPSGAEMQQTNLKPTPILGDVFKWDPLDLADSQSSDARSQSAKIAHGRAIMAGVASKRLQETCTPEEKFKVLKKNGLDSTVVAGAMAVTMGVSPLPAFATSSSDLPIVQTTLIAGPIVLFGLYNAFKAIGRIGQGDSRPDFDNLNDVSSSQMRSMVDAVVNEIQTHPGWKDVPAKAVQEMVEQLKAMYSDDGALYTSRDGKELMTKTGMLCRELVLKYKVQTR